MRTTLVFCFLFGFSPSILAQANRPQATCIPTDQPDWPVQAIYMHGWFTASGSSLTSSRQTEFNNRRTLENLARDLQVRIAVPIGPHVGSNGMQAWDGASLAEIEQLSRAACGGAALQPNRSLMGFSNGGFAAKNIGQLPCRQLSQYRRVLAIGTNNSYPDRCQGVFHNVPAHVFPPNNLVELSGIQPATTTAPTTFPFLEGSPSDN